MTVILFEDTHVDQLAPAILAQPAYAISCGGVRLADVVTRLGQPVLGIVRTHLRSIQQQTFPDFEIRDLAGEGGDAIDEPLLINSRLVPSIAAIEQLKTCLTVGPPRAVWQDGQLVAARFGESISKHELEFNKFQSCLNQITAEAYDSCPFVGKLLSYPHDIIRHHLEIFADNLNYLIGDNEYQEVADGVFSAPDTTIGQHIVTNTELGPIVLQQGSVVSPFSSLTGPLLLGPLARIAPHSTIKHGVSVGHTCKVGGEVQATIFEPYSNKQHHGYLGHSYIGSWVNLGAGTSNSNLKNTYGDVRIRLANESVNTGMTFFGCVVGDYTKSAINTAIFTGKLIGVGSMLYGYVTENVGSFVNYARHLGDVTAADIESTLTTQSRVFARRKLTAHDFEQQLLRDVFELTRSDRQGLLNRPPRFAVRPTEDVPPSAFVDSDLASDPFGRPGMGG